MKDTDWYSTRMRYRQGVASERAILRAHDAYLAASGDVRGVESSLLYEMGWSIKATEKWLSERAVTCSKLNVNS
jgi:hypothetical protein